MQLSSIGWNPIFEAHCQLLNCPHLLPGRIVSQFGDSYSLWFSGGETRATISGRYLFHVESGETEFPVVGDWVLFAIPHLGDPGIIHQILPRSTQISRKVAGSKTQTQIIVANVDNLFIVAGLDRDFNLGKIERFLYSIKPTGVQTILLLNKLDLCPLWGEILELCGDRIKDTPIFPTSIHHKETLLPLTQFLGFGKSSAFAGSSGVGKSSLLNLLLGDDPAFIQPIISRDGRGRHTTTRRQAYHMPGGGLLFDTPGMKEWQVWFAEDEDKENSGEFQDIIALAATCQYRDCHHQTEPGCKITAAIEAGTLDSRRLQNMRKLEREKEFFQRRHQEWRQMEQKQKWKRISQNQRQKRRFEESIGEDVDPQ